MLSVSRTMEDLTLQDSGITPPKVEEEEKKEQQENEEEEVEEEEEFKPAGIFPFLRLPTELRLRVFSFVMFASYRRRLLLNTGTVGASSKSPPIAPLSERLSLFLVSKQIHAEASYHFYSTQTFRVFPIQDYYKLPTVRFLSPRSRASLSNIELILGSSWTKPPKSWVVNNGLGLEDMHCVHTLKVFIECDPSHPVFEGFRVTKDFYTEFAGDLLHKILERLPSLINVEFDGYPSVGKNGPLMARLLKETKDFEKNITFGPSRRWREEEPKGKDIAVSVI